MIELLMEALVVMLVGMSAVFASLLFFYLLIIALSKIEYRINNIRVGNLLKPKSVIKDQQAVDVINPEIVAVIAAAAYEALSKPVVIKKIRYLKQSTESSWAESGRLTIMGSHNIRK